MSPRTPIETFGHRGHTVNVFAMRLGDEDVARVEWREPGVGGKVRKTETFRGAKRDREARAKTFAKAKADYLGTPQDGPRERITVKALWEAYVTAMASDWRPKTKTLALQRWKVFSGPDGLDPRTFADLVTPEHLDAFRLRLLTVPRSKTAQPMAKNQVAHHIQLVKSVWKFARQRKLLAENVLLDYAVRKGRDYGAREVPEYTPDEWAAILGALDYRNAKQWRAWAALALIGLLAPRSRAFLALEWSNVDLTARLVRWPADTDKVGKSREQPLPRDAVFALRVCRVWARRDGYDGPLVFFGAQDRTRGKPWTYSALNKALHDACERAGVAHIKYRAMHGLRRMRGKTVLAATGDLTKVGQWLGDSDVRVLTKSYLRARPDDLVDVVAGATLPDRPPPSRDRSGNETATAPTGDAASNTVTR